MTYFVPTDTANNANPAGYLLPAALRNFVRRPAIDNFRSCCRTFAKIF
jgi:hypothetical protein